MKAKQRKIKIEYLGEIRRDRSDFNISYDFFLLLFVDILHGQEKASKAALRL